MRAAGDKIDKENSREQERDRRSIRGIPRHPTRRPPTRAYVRTRPHSAQCACMPRAHVEYVYPARVRSRSTVALAAPPRLAQAAWDPCSAAEPAPSPAPCISTPRLAPTRAPLANSDGASRRIARGAHHNALVFSFSFLLFFAFVHFTHLD